MKNHERYKLDKSSSGDVPADIIKQSHLCFQVLTKCINQSIVETC